MNWNWQNMTDTFLPTLSGMIPKSQKDSSTLKKERRSCALGSSRHGSHFLLTSLCSCAAAVLFAFPSLVIQSCRDHLSSGSPGHLFKFYFNLLTCCCISLGGYLKATSDSSQMFVISLLGSGATQLSFPFLWISKVLTRNKKSPTLALLLEGARVWNRFTGMVRPTDHTCTSPGLRAPTQFPHAVVHKKTFSLLIAAHS